MIGKTVYLITKLSLIVVYFKMYWTKDDIFRYWLWTLKASVKLNIEGKCMKHTIVELVCKFKNLSIKMVVRMLECWYECWLLMVAGSDQLWLRAEQEEVSNRFAFSVCQCSPPWLRLRRMSSSEEQWAAAQELLSPRIIKHHNKMFSRISSRSGMENIISVSCSCAWEASHWSALYTQYICTTHTYNTTIQHFIAYSNSIQYQCQG